MVKAMFYAYITWFTGSSYLLLLLKDTDVKV